MQTIRLNADPIHQILRRCGNYDHAALLMIVYYINERSNGMRVIENRYRTAIEEIITINELQQWTYDLADKDIDGIIRDIDIYYKLEMNMDASDDE